MTSKEAMTSESLMGFFESALNHNSKLLLIWLSAIGKHFAMILRRYEANEYNAVLVEETMMRKGIFCLCILGRPYALGRRESLDLKEQYIIPWKSNPFLTSFLGYRLIVFPDVQKDSWGWSFCRSRLSHLIYIVASVHCHRYIAFVRPCKYYIWILSMEIYLYIDLYNRPIFLFNRVFLSQDCKNV